MFKQYNVISHETKLVKSSGREKRKIKSDASDYSYRKGSGKEKWS